MFIQSLVGLWNLYLIYIKMPWSSAKTSGWYSRGTQLDICHRQISVVREKLR